MDAAIPREVAKIEEEDTEPRLRFRTIFISDIHLGTPGCQAAALLSVLRHTESRELYLVGDIIDGDLFDAVVQGARWLAHEARRRGFDGVVCGHIHKAEIRDIGGVRYCNDGDWVESLTALVEHGLRHGMAFTTAYHTCFPEYVKPRFGVPLSWTYAWRWRRTSPRSSRSTCRPARSWWATGRSAASSSSAFPRRRSWASSRARTVVPARLPEARLARAA